MKVNTQFCPKLYNTRSLQQRGSSAAAAAAAAVAGGETAATAAAALATAEGPPLPVSTLIGHVVTEYKLETGWRWRVYADAS